MHLPYVGFVQELNDMPKPDLPALLKEFRTVRDRLDGIPPDQAHDLDSVLIQKVLCFAKDNEILGFSAEEFPETHRMWRASKELMPNISQCYWRAIMPNTVYSLHIDPGGNVIHIPLITNDGCLFVYVNKAFRMTAGQPYIVDNSKEHTFANAGPSERIHLTFEVV